MAARRDGVKMASVNSIPETIGRCFVSLSISLRGGQFPLMMSIPGGRRKVVVLPLRCSHSYDLLLFELSSLVR